MRPRRIYMMLWGCNMFAWRATAITDANTEKPDLAIVVTKTERRIAMA